MRDIKPPGAIVPPSLTTTAKTSKVAPIHTQVPLPGLPLKPHQLLASTAAPSATTHDLNPGYGAAAAASRPFLGWGEGDARFEDTSFYRFIDLDATGDAVPFVETHGGPLKSASEVTLDESVVSPTVMTNMAGLAVSEKVGGMMKSDDRAVFKVVMPMRPTLSVDTRPPPVAVLNKEISKGDLPTPLTPTTRKGSPKRQQKKAQDDCDLAPGEEWRCVECGVREHETPLKRKGPDKKRNLCNACYVRWRVRAERAERGSARPVLSDSGAYGSSTGAMANRAFPPQHNSQAKIEIPASPITGKYSTQGTHTITHPNTVYHNQNSNQNNHSVNSRASSFFLGRQGSAMSMGQSRGSSMVDMFGASVGESPSSASMAAALAVQVAAAEAAGFNGGMSSWTSYMLAAGASALDDASQIGTPMVNPLDITQHPSPAGTPFGYYGKVPDALRVLPEDEFVSFGGGMGDFGDFGGLPQNTSGQSHGGLYGWSAGLQHYTSMNELGMDGGSIANLYDPLHTSSLAALGADVNTDFGAGMLVASPTAPQWNAGEPPGGYFTLFEDVGYTGDMSTFHDDRYGLYDGGDVTHGLGLETGMGILGVNGSPTDNVSISELLEGGNAVTHDGFPSINGYSSLLSYSQDTGSADSAGFPPHAFQTTYGNADARLASAPVSFSSAVDTPTYSNSTITPTASQIMKADKTPRPPKRKSITHDEMVNDLEGGPSRPIAEARKEAKRGEKIVLAGSPVKNKKSKI